MKLNNLSRLTALLLALTLILSSVAWAAPVTEGDFTFDNYEEMLAAQTGTCETCASALGYFPETDQFGNPIEITCVYEYLLNLGGTQNQYDFIKFLYDNIRTEWSTVMGEYDDHMTAGDAPILCSCKSLTSDPPVPGDGTHAEDCPWYEMTLVDPTDPDQPPLYHGNPQGNQYTSNETYNLADLGNRAVILPKGGRAVIQTGETTGYQWQVFDGTQWIDIQGETAADIAVTDAKLNTIFELTGIAQLRYFDKDSSIVLASVSVTSQEIAGGEYVDEPVEAARNLTLTERAEGDTVDENEWTVTVHFVFANSTDPVSDDKVGEFPAGEAVAWSVPLPTETGYYPTYNNVDISEQTTFDIALDTITGNIEYTIVYKPSNVKYTVKHYLQKVDAESGDKTEANYELAADDTVQHDGLTGQMISETLDEDEALHKDYDGFRMIPYSTNFRVAADASTVLEIYYDRDYYLMKFSLGDGGYGMEPIYDRYGADLTITTPTRPGYTFDGWDLATGQDADGNYVGDGTAETTMPPTMPAENRTYVALWTPVDKANVTIVFWGENADNEEYSYLSSNTVTAPSGKPYVYGGATLTCTQAQHTHSTSCGVKCDQEEHAHTVDCRNYDKLICGYTEHTAHTDACYGNCTYIHTHTRDCYSGASEGSLSDDATTSGNWYKSCVQQLAGEPDGGIYQVTRNNGYYTETRYYAKIAGQYYRVEATYGWGGSSPDENTTLTLACNDSHTHNDSCLSCDLPLHTHTDTCYEFSCGKDEHTHTGECYTCGLAEHTHDADCFTSDPTHAESNLWVFAGMDVVTVNPDGSSVVNVYWDRTEFTLNFRAANETNQNRYGTITAKWGQKIRDRFTQISEAASCFTWTKTQSGNSGPYIGHIEVMPDENINYYKHSTSGNDSVAKYYGQKLDLSGFDEENPLKTVTIQGSFHITPEDFAEFQGFTFSYATNDDDRDAGTITNIAEYSNVSFDGMEFYYTRNRYTLVLNNGETNQYVFSSDTTNYPNPTGAGVLYEAPLSTYNVAAYTPSLPSFYEPGSRDFDGWYLNKECTGAEYDLSAHTMPADNLILYAKWELVTHEVYFYEDEAAYDAGNKYIADVVEVTHGNYVDNKLTDENRTDDYDAIDNIDELYKGGKYTFLGWFYKDGDKEKAFDPFDMPVKRELHLYAKWSSDVLVDFDVNYVLQSNPDIKVAESITGQALAATTETYEAKTGTDLYNSLQGNGVNYQSGYFPTVSSHSIVFVIEETAEKNNSCTFYYVPMEIVPYTVYYVTETPAEGDEDKYTQIELNGKTYYMLADTEVYAENTKSVVTEPYKPVAGYKPNAYQQKLILSVVWDETKNEFVPNDAANIIIFEYMPDPTSTTYYIQHYIGDGDGEWTFYAEEPRPGNYGDKPYAQPITIPGYTFDPDEELTVREGTLVEGEKLILKLYYVQQEVEIKYEVVGPDGVDVSKTCTVSPTQETVKVIEGKATGSTAATSDNTFKFVGWYLDKACTKPVPDEWITNTDHITPQKTKDYDETLDGEKFGYEAATYYAKFEYNVSDLIVEKTGMHTGESAVVRVVITNDNDVDEYTIVLNADVDHDNDGTPSVIIKDVLIGSTYTVSELDAWTWRYDSNEIVTYVATPDSEGNYKIVADVAKNTVIVINSKQTYQWLSDESAVENDLSTGTGNDYNND